MTGHDVPHRRRPARPALPASPNRPALNAGDTAWLLAASALVLLMAPGLALFYGGMVRSKSVLNMIMMTFGALAVITVLVGPGRLLPRLRRRRRRRACSATRASTSACSRWSPALGGRLAERAGHPVRGLPGPVLRDHRRAGLRRDRGPGPLRRLDRVRRRCGPCWSTRRSRTGSSTPTVPATPAAGWSNRIGLVDFAGGTAVEICSGASALALALVVGHPRRVRQGADASAQPDPGDARRGTAVVRLVRLQRRLGAAGGPHRGGRVRHHPVRRCRRLARLAG